MLDSVQSGGRQEVNLEMTSERSTDEHRASASVNKFMDQMVKWLGKITTPEFREFQHQRIGFILADDLERETLPREDFRFDEDVEKQHNLITSFLNLHTSARVLRQCEHYFRRYLFRGGPISREDHARNMCEFYLGNVYVLRSRLKTFLNNLVKVCPEIQVDVAATLKSFNRVFDQELRMRNGVTHHEPFSDVVTEKLFITGLLAKHPPLKEAALDRVYLSTYRTFVNSWARRVRNRSQTVELLIDSIAELLVQKANFLSHSESGSA
jgi:hypothetical protein